ncbi:MAG: hypothetical protein QOD74_3111 [Variibacter sp.]|jgi:hypothetical protein|nr:hypothetical protein [Variibacter sp.]
MLVSHRKKFIFIKTRKTAGTSIEVFFEPYCRAPGCQRPVLESTEESIDEYGIVGCRAADIRGRRFYNHMPAEDIRANVDDRLWNSYLKITCTRNPFDQMVSRFWFYRAEETRSALQLLETPQLQAAFSEWILGTAHLPANDRLICIDGRLAADRVIRYETLRADLNAVCEDIGIPYDEDRLVPFKVDARRRSLHYSDYYNAASRRFVEKFCETELRLFGYQFEPAQNVAGVSS